MAEWGFTLLEVMVAIVILSLLMMSASIITSRSFGARERFEKRDAVFHQGQVAIGRISHDLEVAFLARQTSPSSSAGSSLPPPSETLLPSSPSKQKWKTFFIGEDRGDEDAIRFTAFSHIRMQEGARESDQCRIAYEVVRSQNQPDLFDLVRKEDAWFDENDLVGGPPFVLAEGIKSFNVEYYDERKIDWGKEWHSERPDWQWKLPQAVRITLTFRNPIVEGKEVIFSTSIPIPLSDHW